MKDNTEPDILRKGTDALNRRSDSLVRELVETETQMTQQALQLLRSQYREEKNKWIALYDNQRREAESLRSKLDESDYSFRKLYDEHVQADIEEIEKLKNAADEASAKKKTEQEKWDFIEEQIKIYSRIASDAQKSLQEEEKNIARLREEFAGHERALRDTIGQRESELLKLKEETALQEESWQKEKSRYEEDISRLKQQLSELKAILQDSGESQAKTAERKDGELSRLQQSLQEIALKFTEEKHRNELLLRELSGRDERIRELDTALEKLSAQFDQDRKRWQSILERERTEHAERENDLTEREQSARVRAEEQSKRFLNMIGSLETHLKTERMNRQYLEKQLKMLQEERKSVEEQCSVLKQKREYEIPVLQNEVSELKANIKEDAKILQMEKEEKREIKLKLARLEESSEKFNSQFEKERNDWENVLLEERRRFEILIKEADSSAGMIKNEREKEIEDLRQEILMLNGELSELRSVYHAKRIENARNESRIQELEVTLGRQIDLFQRERSEWENLLFSEQEQWETRKKEIQERSDRFLAEREKEVKRMESALDETKAKLFEAEKTLLARERELARKTKSPEECEKKGEGITERKDRPEG